MRSLFKTILRIVFRQAPTCPGDPVSSGARGQQASAVPTRPTKQPNGVLTRNPLGPVLMLDFDGVLHIAQSGHLDRLPMLEAWLRQNPKVDVVLTTNWRDTDSMEDLCACFSEDIRHRVLGGTPNLMGAAREDEILALVRRYQIRQWIALDDRFQEFLRTGPNHLVCTEYLTGLTPAHLDRMSELLAHSASAASPA